jgi:hypothetical protein
VLLAVIGPRWLTAAGTRGRRLDDPADLVRLEIEAALTRGVLVIPVLVGGARMPSTDELPVSLRLLAGRQAVELDPARFSADIDRLAKVLSAAIPGAAGARDGVGTLAGAERSPGLARAEPGAGYPEFSGRRWHLAVFLPSIVLPVLVLADRLAHVVLAYGLALVLLLLLVLFKRSRAVRMNAILSLEISFYSFLGNAIVHYFMAGSSDYLPGFFERGPYTSFGYCIYGSFSIILIYCAVRVCFRRQPVIPVFTRIAYRLAYGRAHRN